MRDHYDFSRGVRGKYAGKVDTANVHVPDSVGPRVDRSAEGLDDRCGDLDGEIRHKRGDTLRKRAGGGSLSKLLKKK